ncbi:UDP-glucuronosyltransferase 2C1-like [Porites lutea]|uniref:UDP-glucuronosyltransferase 2C1-like n=1 Tax=Porites lutea TaxID=51062 RepID=UPI003CC50EA5
MALLVLILLSLTVSSVSSAQIAGFISLGGSQYMTLRRILEELASRGHQVSLIVPSAQKIKPSEKVPHKTYQVPLKPDYLDDAIRLDINGPWLQAQKRMRDVLNILCEGALNSSQVLKEVKDFDLLLYASPMGMCAPLVGELLGIPRVEILLFAPNTPFSFDHMIPMPVSYVPLNMLGFNDKMMFMERVINLAAYFGSKLLWDLVVASMMNDLKVKYNIKPERSYQEAAGGAELVLIAADFALEYPQPLLPGNRLVGPLNVRDTIKPLPPDLDEFVSNSGGHGFIIVSFGSNVASILPREIVDMLATAFGKLKQLVVWRLKGYIPAFLAKNIKVMDWLPQNDLLAHKDIKAFISHVGHNSLYESAYHGVPLVCFPLYAEQHANAKKVEHFGLGLAVYHDRTNAQELYKTIELVISEPRFKQSAMLISSQLKDRRSPPLQEACDWIEYVLRHGGAKHLRPQVFHIPWYQYYLLDVTAFLVAVVTVIVVMMWLTCKCLCRLHCRSDDGKTKKE